MSNSLRMPNGKLAGNTDCIMVLADWAGILEDEGQSIVAAGMGKPSFPVHPNLVSTLEEEIKRISDAMSRARAYLSDPTLTDEQRRNAIAECNAVIGYDNPQGKLSARNAAAQALSESYQVDIKPENLLFTTGGAGALYNVFSMLNSRYPHGKIVTPFPYYPLCGSSNNRANHLHPIHVMEEEGYKLTANALAKSIAEAQRQAELDGCPISAFLFCDPSNPLGTVVSKEEWRKIAEVLATVPNVPVIFDGAYAEMVFDPKNRTSLLEVADEALKKRIILLRSGTKGLSAPGLRMAVTVAFDEEILNLLKTTNIDTSGLPVTLIQNAFAKMLSMLNEETEMQHFVNHYQPQVELVYERLKKMGAAMPNPHYKPEGTFYVMGDFTDLLNTPLDPKTKKAVGDKEFITNDEDLCYDLLFKNGAMIAPLSYFGLNGEKNAFMRITCSGGDQSLNHLMNILSERLLNARVYKINEAVNDANVLLNLLKKTEFSKQEITEIEAKIKIVRASDFPESHMDEKAKAAKKMLNEIQQVNETLKQALTTHHPKIAALQHVKDTQRNNELLGVQTLWRAKKNILSNWKEYVHSISDDPEYLRQNLTANVQKRATFKQWVHSDVAKMPEIPALEKFRIN